MTHDPHPEEIVKAADDKLWASFPSTGCAVHKKSGRAVFIRDVSLRENDLVPLVNYRERNVMWSRPLDEFLEKFSRPGDFES